MAAYNLPRMVRDEEKYMETVIPPLAPPFAARASMNQDFFVNRNEPKSVEPLEEVPNAAPCMSVADIFDLRGFRSPELWKFAMLECVGKGKDLRPNLRQKQKIRLRPTSFYH